MTEWNSCHFIALCAYVPVYRLLWSHEACESPGGWSLKNAFEGVVRKHAGEWELIWEAEVMGVDLCSLGTVSQSCSLINMPALQLHGASSCFKIVHLYSFPEANEEGSSLEIAILTAYVNFPWFCPSINYIWISALLNSQLRIHGFPYQNSETDEN